MSSLYGREFHLWNLFPRQHLFNDNTFEIPTWMEKLPQSPTYSRRGTCNKWLLGDRDQSNQTFPIMTPSICYPILNGEPKGLCVWAKLNGLNTHTHARTHVRTHTYTHIHGMGENYIYSTIIRSDEFEKD